jgi:hypothetical protein
MDVNPIEEGQLERAGFGKQRRNLLVISILLAAGLWVGVNFESLRKITIYGHELLLLYRPEGIAHVAWIVWLYFLIRYIGFHHEYQKPDEKFLYYFRSDLTAKYFQIAESEFRKQGKYTDFQYGMRLLSVTFLGASCSILMPARPVTGLEKKEPINLSISPTKIWFARLKALTKALFGKASTSEYYLPYLVAFLPVLLILIR